MILDVHLGARLEQSARRFDVKKAIEQRRSPLAIAVIYIGSGRNQIANRGWARRAEDRRFAIAVFRIWIGAGPQQDDLGARSLQNNRFRFRPPK
jgi:hypothetical protein